MTEGLTETQRAQGELERQCAPLLAAPRAAVPTLGALRAQHAAFLRGTLGLGAPLPAGFLALDASHPWIVFWAVNALALLGAPLGAAELARTGDTLLSCQHAAGGFGGGPGQPGHLAATYAAVAALAHCEPRHWAAIDRARLHAWLLSLKTRDGAIRVCAHGEADPRAAYCALAVATLLGINTPQLRAGVGGWLERCQTYEGGFANEPYGEAHGGYAFCSLAALVLLDPDGPPRAARRHCDATRLARWLVARQDPRLGGFSGRTNKLVDGCYSHWVGGCWALLAQLLPPPGAGAGAAENRELFDREGLQRYILCCGQNATGGLRDKPGTRPDAYHTNYTLCGLAAAQYRYTQPEDGGGAFAWAAEPAAPALGGDNGVPPIHPLFGVPFPHIARMHAWVSANPLPDAHTAAQDAAASGVTASVTATDASVTAATTATTATAGTVPQAVPPARAAAPPPPPPPPSPSSREYQGFATYVGATIVLIAYLLWALLPASWLNAINVSYYPSRWWAIAVPAWIMMLVLFVYVALNLVNTERLTYAPHAPETICDKDTEVHDTPLATVNARMYGTRSQ